MLKIQVQAENTKKNQNIIKRENSYKVKIHKNNLIKSRA